GGLCAPGERPDARRGFGPTAAVHPGFIHEVRPWRAIVLLHERFFDRVQIQCVAPLHAVAWKRLLLSSHAAELHNFQLFQELLRNAGEPLANLGRREHMAVARTRVLNDNAVVLGVGRFVPVLWWREWFAGVALARAGAASLLRSALAGMGP